MTTDKTMIFQTIKKNAMKKCSYKINKEMINPKSPNQFQTPNYKKNQVKQYYKGSSNNKFSFKKSLIYYPKNKTN